MTDDEAKEQFEAQVRERVESLRRTFTPLTERLTPGDEPAPVFAPYVNPDKS
jgi:hypothetical protein